MSRKWETFIADENGSISVEWLCIIAIVAALLGVVAGIGLKVKGIASTAQEKIEAMTGDINSMFEG